MNKFKENISIISVLMLITASLIFFILYLVGRLDNNSYRTINEELKDTNYELKQEVNKLRQENLKCNIRQN